MFRHYKQSNNLNVSYDASRDRDRGGRDSSDGGRSRGAGTSSSRYSGDNASSSRSRYGNGTDGGNGNGRDEARLFINVGKIDRMNKDSLIKFIATSASVDGACVSRISMQNTRSFFTVEDARKAQAIVNTLKDSTA